MRPFLFIILLLLWHGVRAEDLPQAAAPHDDIDMTVTLDSAEQSGNASANVLIHARREIVWALITSCPESVRMVPGLEVCDVLDTAPDRSWQTIRHVMNYSWYLPKLTYEIRASYEQPARVSIERVSGDLRTLRCSWVLTSKGDSTLAHYSVDLAPGFWVPHWMVRSALRHDLPKMLLALRARAEDIQSQAVR